MATIKVIIYDDFGHEIGIQEKTMKSSLHDFDAIEEEVVLFRQKVMPEITKILLESQQKAFKKKSIKK